jgi:hypothetical protein
MLKKLALTFNTIEKIDMLNNVIIVPLDAPNRLRNKPFVLKKLLLITFLSTLAFGLRVKAQKIDSIFFNLYTDSLKKGTYNYINVDGKLSDGRWMPLTAKEIQFSTTAGTFDGNSLVLDKDFKEEKVTVTATLKSNSNISKSVTIYIKRNPDNEKLKTTEEILREMEEQSRQKQKKSRT